ncbi:MAG: WXG100 family type VII secretion target [Candidatus Micrarchaeaceae archaeon]
MGVFMPQAIANPEDLERFASELKRFNSQLAESMSRLSGQFSRLGDTWRDQEHQKFAQEFEQTMRVLHHFMRTSEQHIPFLLRKAQRLREYLTQR